MKGDEADGDGPEGDPDLFIRAPKPDNSLPEKEGAEEDQPLTHQEEQLLAKFDRNDKEIDELLEGVID